MSRSVPLQPILLLIVLPLLVIDSWSTAASARSGAPSASDLPSLSRAAHTDVSASADHLANPMLLAEAHDARAGTRHAPRAGGRAALLPIQITSTRDVSAAIRALGGRVEAVIANRITAADLPATTLVALAQQPGVLALYPSVPVYAGLDRSVPEIGADRVWTVPDRNGLPIRGRHVLVGVVDSGIDYHNPDFKNPDGSTRIKYIWDQTESGKPPAAFDFGYECEADSINSGTCPERDTDGHGTMVDGIAVGNGRSSTPEREIGVAPEADIIVVKRGDGADATNDNIAAWKYLVQKAQQLGEPIVINNSWGSGMTPHDGSSPEALAIDALSGPGRIFVAAAGNEANQRLHVDGTLQQGATTSIQLAADTYEARAAFAVFFAPGDQLTFTLTDTDTGESFGPITAGESIDGRLSRDGATRVTIQPGLWDAQHSGVYVVLESASARQLHDHYRLELDGQRVTGDGRYDAWMENDHEASFSGADESDTIGDPADAHSAIAVGDYITRAAWSAVDGRQYLCSPDLCPNGQASVGEIAISSSGGPTADGRQKPDIAAPGAMIFSSLSHDATICSGSSTAGCIPQWRVTQDGKNQWRQKEHQGAWESCPQRASRSARYAERFRWKRCIWT